MSEAGGSPPPGPRNSRSRGSQHPKPPSRSRSLEQRPVGLPASLPPRPPHVPPAHTLASLCPGRQMLLKGNNATYCLPCSQASKPSSATKRHIDCPGERGPCSPGGGGLGPLQPSAAFLSRVWPPPAPGGSGTGGHPLGLPGWGSASSLCAQRRPRGLDVQEEKLHGRGGCRCAGCAGPGAPTAKFPPAAPQGDAGLGCPPGAAVSPEGPHHPHPIPTCSRGTHPAPASSPRCGRGGAQRVGTLLGHLRRQLRRKRDGKSCTWPQSRFCFHYKLPFQRGRRLGTLPAQPPAAGPCQQPRPRQEGAQQHPAALPSPLPAGRCGPFSLRTTPGRRPELVT